ncbi:MAG: pyridoxal kinase PdxY [Marivibrio sp.]|uniref:pyridoxal kinase PdxY n=1 Tax=Marivibrio sp. TaxID=2039719 RepID=UPI0032F0812E
MPLLSIQSHVTFGHVGNSAAVFPLQRMGWDVWPVHTVLFSNHPGYGAFRGAVTPVETVRAVLTGLGERGALGACDGVVSGYVGEAALGDAILSAVAEARAANPKARYVCDPVMGDRHGGLYVADSIPPFMRDRAIPACDAALPNHFELEVLTGRRVETLADARAAADSLRARGPDVVVVTSLERRGAPEGAIEMLLAAPEGAWLIETPRLPFDHPPNGAGDLTAALFAGWWLGGTPAHEALARTASSVFAVLEETRARGRRELALVAAQDKLVDPPRRFEAHRLG